MINTNICNFFDADYEGYLKKLLEIKGYIEQYNRIHKKSIITNELKSLISEMMNTKNVNKNQETVSNNVVNSAENDQNEGITQ